MAQSRKTAKKKVASGRASKAPVGVRGRRIKPPVTGSPRELT